MEKMKIGVVGCGNISDIYISNLMNVFDNTEVIACANRSEEKARKTAEKYGLKFMTVDEILASDEVDTILNLTVPLAHYEISKKALTNGKHVYSEKPFALTVVEGQDLLDTARAKGLKIGCATDTFMGAGVQTAKEIVQSGKIGTPVGATAFYMARGHEHWHPSPEFYYKKGGGPVFDMGPYYLSAMIEILGKVDSVASLTKTTQSKKPFLVGERAGELFDVETPTYIASLLNFECGVAATFTATFDLTYQYTDSKLPFVEIYGTKGTVSLPDPNCFGGVVKMRTTGEFEEVPLVNNFTENLRGIGLSQDFKASGELAQHVLAIMEGILAAGESGLAYVVNAM